MLWVTLSFLLSQKFVYVSKWSLQKYNVRRIVREVDEEVELNSEDTNMVVA